MTPLREQIVAEARGWLGTAYHHQASLKGVGCDCLGLVRGVWRAIYGTEPEAPPAYTRSWAETKRQETLAEGAGRHLIAVPVADAQPGDVLLFAFGERLPAKHCAILVGRDAALSRGRMIHAIESHAVAEVSVGPWWARRARFAFAFPER